jgi:hypothetical protein
MDRWDRLLDLGERETIQPTDGQKLTGAYTVGPDAARRLGLNFFNDV